MTVHFDSRVDKWCYSFWHQKRRYSGYCIDPLTGCPAQTKTEARHIEDGIRVAIRNRPGVQATAPIGYTVAQMFADWLDSIEDTANFGNAVDHVSELLARDEFAPDKLAEEISEQDIEAYIRWAKKQPLRVWIGGPDRERATNLPEERRWKIDEQGRLRTASTINHYLASLSAAMGRAHRLRDPVTRRRLLPDLPTIPKLKPPKRKPRPISDADIARIVAQCCRVSAQDRRKYRKHLAHAVLLCRQMGFRFAEAFGLVIDRIDIENCGYWLPGDVTKNRTDEFMPAPPQAMKLLLWLRARAVALGQTRLILYREADGSFRPVTRPKSGWNATLAELGLEHHTFHQTKASFSTALGRVASSKTVQSLSRHQDPRTTERYLVALDSDRRSAADAIGFTAPRKNEPSHSEKSQRAAAGGRLKLVK